MPSFSRQDGLTVTLSLKWIFPIVGIILLGLVAWATAPMFHWLWWWIFLLHPIGTVFAITIVIGLVLLIGKYIDSLLDEGGCLITIGIVIGILWLIFYGFLSAGITHQYLVQDIQPEKISQLPETTEIRYLPMAVAERFIDNKIQDPLHHRGDTDPLDQGEELNWVAPRIPTGFWNMLFQKTDGFMVVHPNGQVDTVNQPQKYGEGMGITDAITWPLWRDRYTVDLPEFYYLQVGDEVLTMAPYISYRFQFPVRVPYWGGVFVVHSDGRIEDLTPEQAQADPRFIGQRLYPEALARRIADAWAWRGGIWNAWFLHRDQTEVPTIEGEQNQMPYLLPTKEGPIWFVGMEPYGPAYSIFKVLIIDAHNGQVHLYELPAESGMTGPNRAAGYVRNAFSDFQWYRKGEKESFGNMLAVEPKPFVRDGVLYWQVSITNIDYAGVRRTALVNALDNSVVYFESLDEMKAFIQGTFPGHVPGEGTQPQITTTVSSFASDLTQMSKEQLLTLMRQVIDELERR